MPARSRRSRGNEPPSDRAQWALRAASAAAAKEWERAKAAEPELLRAVAERLRERPLDRSDNPNRTHRLKPPLDAKRIGDRKLAQWQYELSGAGRIHYCPDVKARVVWITMVTLTHPRETE